MAHPYQTQIKRRLFTSRRLWACADWALALAIGVGLAAVLVAWWSS
jgi:hypothetical protein